MAAIDPQPEHAARLAELVGVNQARGLEPVSSTARRIRL